MLIKRLLAAKNIRFLAFLYTLGITILMVTPISRQREIDVPNFDKLVHIGVYVLFSFLWLWAFLLKIKKNASLLWMIVGAILIYGIVIEVIQGNFIPTRSFDLLDILANSIGIFIGGLLFWRFKKYRKV